MTVEIYGKDACPWCDRAVEICEQYGIDYEYKSLDDRFDGETHMAEFRKRFPEAKKVPQIVWNDKHIGGFDQFATELENTRNFGQEKI